MLIVKCYHDIIHTFFAFHFGQIFSSIDCSVPYLELNAENATADMTCSLSLSLLIWTKRSKTLSTISKAPLFERAAEMYHERCVVLGFMFLRFYRA